MQTNYYISFNDWSSETEIFLSNSPKVSGRQEAGQIFLRDEVDEIIIGSLLNASVYTTLDTYFFTPANFTTEVGYKIVSGSKTFYFAASITDGKIDTEKKVYTITPKPDDAYRDILNLYEKKFQDRIEDELFGFSEGFTWPSLSTAFFVGWAGAPYEFTSFSDTNPGGSVSWENNTGGECRAEHSITVLTGVSSQMVVVTIKNYVASGPGFDLFVYDGSYVTRSNTESITADGKYYLTLTTTGTLFVVMSQTDIVGSNGTFDYELYVPTVKESGNTVQNILTTILTGASYMNLSIATPVSTILWNDALESDPPPNIDTYITASPTTDYVIEDTAQWNRLWLTRVDALTTKKNEKYDTSLKDVMDVLRKLRMWWFIDSDGKFRIEHEMYFRDYAAQANITAGGYVAYKPETDVKNYNYAKEDVYSQINYIENNQLTADFVAYPVLFNQAATSDRIIEIRNANLSTDIKYITDNPGEAANAGLILLKTTGTSYLVDVEESTLLAGFYYPNVHLGWAWLAVNYYDYFAEALSGTVNGGAHTYQHVKEFLQQEDVRFYSASSISWKKPLTTALGTAWIRSYEYDCETGFYSINLGYDPYA